MNRQISWFGLEPRYTVRSLCQDGHLMYQIKHVNSEISIQDRGSGQKPLPPVLLTSRSSALADRNCAAIGWRQQKRTGGRHVQRQWERWSCQIGGNGRPMGRPWIYWMRTCRGLLWWRRILGIGWDGDRRATGDIPKGGSQKMKKKISLFA